MLDSQMELINDTDGYLSETEIDDVAKSILIDMQKAGNNFKQGYYFFKNLVAVAECVNNKLAHAGAHYAAEQQAPIVVEVGLTNSKKLIR